MAVPKQALFRPDALVKKIFPNGREGIEGSPSQGRLSLLPNSLVQTWVSTPLSQIGSSINLPIGLDGIDICPLSSSGGRHWGLYPVSAQ